MTITLLTVYLPSIAGKFAGPEHVLATSSAVVWWRCPAAPDHVWASSVASRVDAYQVHAKKRGHHRDGNAATAGVSGATLSIKGRLEGLLRSPPAKSSRQSSDLGELLPGATSVIMSPLARGKENMQTAAIVAARSPAPTAMELNSTDSASFWGCPCCAGKQVSVTNSLVSLAPRVARLWHPTANQAGIGSGSASTATTSHSSSTSISRSSSSSIRRGQGAKAPRAGVTPPAVRAREVMAASLAPCVLRCCPTSTAHPRSFPSVRQACAEAAAAEAAAAVGNGTWSRYMCWWQCQPCAEEAASSMVDLVVNAATRNLEDDAIISDEEEESETEDESSEDESDEEAADDVDEKGHEHATAVRSEATPSAAAVAVAKEEARTGPGWWVTDMRGRVHQQLKNRFPPASQQGEEVGAIPAADGPVEGAAAVPIRGEGNSMTTKSKACILS